MSSKIKVVYLLNHISNGGIEHFLLNYLKNNENPNLFEFSLIYSGMCNAEICEEFQKCNVQILKTKHSVSNHQLAYLRDLVKLFRKNKYDVVHCNISQNNFYGLLAGLFAGVSVRISHSHMNIRECYAGAKTSFIRRLIRNSKIYLSDVLANKRFACSEAAGKSSFFGSFIVIPNAIQMQRFSYDSSIRLKYRKKLHVGDEHLYGFFGRLHEDKNPIFALSLFENIKSIDSDAKFLLIGYGGLEKEVFHFIENSNYQKDIIYINSVTDIWNYYQAIDELIFPSKSEGLGMVAVEAQISGLPVITTTGVPEDVKISDSIVFMNLSTPIEEWRDVCLKMIRVDRGQVAFNKNYNTYDIHKQVGKLFDNY